MNQEQDFGRLQLTPPPPDDPKQKKRLLEALNKDTMDAAAPIGNGEMTILKAVESLDQEHELYMQELKDGSHVEQGESELLRPVQGDWLRTPSLIPAVSSVHFEYERRRRP